MNQLFGICFFLIAAIGFSQSKTIIGFNEVLDLGEVEIKFENVLNDSRCPKSVMCVRAGEVEILVSIFKNGKFIENRKLISSFMRTQQNTNLVYKGKDYHIYGWSVTPYPATPDTIKLEDYSLELVLSEVN